MGGNGTTFRTDVAMTLLLLNAVYCTDSGHIHDSNILCIFQIKLQFFKLLCPLSRFLNLFQERAGQNTMVIVITMELIK